ncbi:MAG: PIN domain-containing protein [Microscillaceae bacterium]|nr:PIN domain-containing protein [Microscillaceae bacterium]
MINSSAIDSNIILYVLDSDEASLKKQVALEIISTVPFFSSQSLSEVINVCHKRWKYDKVKLIGVANFLLINCTLVPITSQTVELTHHLLHKYHFQYFDSLIVAAALENDCKTLYSEDMQHELLVENSLSILNPFLA